MIKYFVYKFKPCYGRARISEKCNFDRYRRIVYPGFAISYSDSENIHFKIDLQITRKLKLKKINEEFKLNSVEGHLYLLLEGSKERVDTERNYPNSYIYYSRGTSGCSEYIIEDTDAESKKEKVRKIINQSRTYSQKLKNYENKGRFRK